MPVFSSSKETSSIVVEKKNEITSPLREAGSRITKDKDNSRSMQDMSDAKTTKSSEFTSVVVGKLSDVAVIGNSGESLQSAADAGKTSRFESSGMVCHIVQFLQNSFLVSYLLVCYLLYLVTFNNVAATCVMFS